MVTVLATVDFLGPLESARGDLDVGGYIQRSPNFPVVLVGRLRRNTQPFGSTGYVE